MKTKTLTFLVLTLCALPWLTANATQTLISGVPNYDQDVFPIDKPYGHDSSTEGGDCVPTACTMLHGYYDANGWPRLIPYGSSAVNQNAWGIDTVVRKYKQQLNYSPQAGTTYYGLLQSLWNVLGNGIVSVTRYFEPSAAFSREDDDWTSWTRVQGYLNASRPCVLMDWPSGAIDSYKWEGYSTLNELGGGHAMCAVGWSDVGGRWVMCNMGWSYAGRGWMNYDGGDDWYLSQITPGGSSSGEDDDAYEDNDTIGTARSISTGTISNLRCLDTLLSGSNYKGSWGDWFKVTASSGQSLSVTTTFTHANGDLDLRVFNPSQTEVGSSTGSGNSESVTASPTTAGSYYIFVYGYNNAKNSSYSLTTSLTMSTATISVVASPSSGGTVGGGGTYTVGSSRQISATANSGWTFTGWSDGNSSNPRTITVPSGGATYTANFQQQTATITVVASPSNGGTVGGGGTYTVGSSRQISATANSGWTFTSWSDGNTSNPRTITVPSGGATYTANFQQQTATITVVASPSNGGTVGGGGTYAVGSSRQISAAPNSGWMFTSWSDGNTANPRTITVPSGGATYTANFQQQTATITVQASPSNGGTVSGGGTYTVGLSQQISATANSGWTFTGWSDGNTSNPRTITVPSGGATYTANFTQQTAVITVVASPSNGGIVSGGGTYTVGLSQQISATANSGWTFTGWSDGNTSNPRTITVPSGGATYTANFTQQTATISVVASPSNGGTVGGGGTYAVGASQQISATANSGWTFTGWNDGNTSNPRTITVPSGGATYTANFTQQTATISVVASPSNGGTVGGGGTFTVGASQQISATANSGWTFTGWSDGNTSNPRTITVPSGGATYTAHFTQQTATISVVASPSNGGMVGGAGTYAVGASQQISAAANSGWTFTGWSDGNTSNPRTITVPSGGATYTANFTQQTAMITVAASPSNGGTVGGGGIFTVGASQQISATANSGWTFAGWSDGNTSNPRTITVPSGGATYTANFQQQPSSSLVVTTTLDSGLGSLRQAILNANTLGGGTITFSNVVGTIVSATPLPVLVAPITIVGPGASQLCVTGNGPAVAVSPAAVVAVSDLRLTGRPMNVTWSGGAVSNAGNLTLTRCLIADSTASQGAGIYNSGGLTLSNCTLTANIGDGIGGGGIGTGLLNDGTATLNNCVITNNNANRGDGGGIYNTGSLSLRGCVLTGNRCMEANGAGIFNSGGNIVMRDCSIIQNSTSTGIGGGYGGGIYNTGYLAVTNCTFAKNTAGGGGGDTGGGIRNWGTAILANTTISGNIVSWSFGAGIANQGTLTIVNSTISSNSAAGGGGTTGGGVWNGEAGTVHCLNTIFAGNTATGGGGDFVGTLTSDGFNLIQNTNGCALAGLATGNRLGVVPQLGPLQDNGGSTWTHALLPGSPAIDAGTMIGTLMFDQRGLSRPQGAASDIGAFEFVSAPVGLSGASWSNKVFRSTLYGLPGSNYALQASSNLVQWLTLYWATIPGGGSIPILDASATNYVRRFYRAVPQNELVIPATSGVITAPFFITSGYIHQTNETTVTTGGRAAYNFTVPTAGNYVIQTMVNAPEGGANSFFVNIDAEPQNPYMVWDIPLTVGFEQRTVSWRGNGVTNSQFVPMVFNLSTNQHQLIIRGREADALLQSMTIVPWP